jgi:hypothetical protein
VLVLGGLAIASALFLVIGGRILLLAVIVVTSLIVLLGWLLHSSALRKRMMEVSYGEFTLVVWQKDAHWFYS